MPKGDINRLKADIEDGFTPIANLILEALAMAKLTGVQKGICLFLFRRTYGWGAKEDEITLKEFAEACNSSSDYVSKQIKRLIKLNVILRTKYEPGKTPTYTFNTRVAQWDKGCLDSRGLSERTRQGLFKRTRVGLSNETRVVQGKSLDNTGQSEFSKESIKEIEINSSSNVCEEDFNFIDFIQKQFCQLLSPTHFEKIKQWQSNFSDDMLKHAVEIALLKGNRDFRYVDGILLNWEASGLKTLEDVLRVEEEFKKRRNKDSPEYRKRPRDEVTEGGESSDSGNSGKVDYDQFSL